MLTKPFHCHHDTWWQSVLY